MTAEIVTLADAVVAELNSPVATTWSQSFTAARHYVIQRDITAISGWLVSVVMAGEEREIDTRRDDRYDFTIDIGIQRKINPTVLAEGDAVLNLAAEFVDYFMRRRLATMTTAICWKIDRPALYIPDHIDQFRVATAILRLTFRY